MNPQVTQDQSVVTDPDGLRSRVILRSDDEQVLTVHRFESPREALARALKEYIEPAAIHWAHGRLLKFQQISVEWEEPEEPAVWPALSIVGEGPGSYDDNGMSSQLYRVGSKTENLWIKQASEVRQNFNLTIWANDPEERAGLLAMLEDLLEPADYMGGVRLELPYYFGARATYLKLTQTFLDTPSTVIERWRQALIAIVAHVPQYVPVGPLVLFQGFGPRVLSTVAAAPSTTDPVAPVSAPANTPAAAVQGIEGVAIIDERLPNLG